MKRWDYYLDSNKSLIVRRWSYFEEIFVPIKIMNPIRKRSFLFFPCTNLDYCLPLSHFNQQLTIMMIIVDVNAVVFTHVSEWSYLGYCKYLDALPYLSASLPYRCKLTNWQLSYIYHVHSFQGLWLWVSTTVFHKLISQSLGFNNHI